MSIPTLSIVERAKYREIPFDEKAKIIAIGIINNISKFLSTNIFFIAGSNSQAVADVLAATIMEKNKANINLFKYFLTLESRSLINASLFVINFYKKLKVHMHKKTTMSSRVLKSIEDYINIVLNIANLIKNLNLKDLIQKTTELSTLKSYYAGQKGEESLSKLENLEELMSTAERFEQNNLDSDNLKPGTKIILPSL